MFRRVFFRAGIYFHIKSRRFIDDRGMGLCAVAYTERVVRVFNTSLFSSYEEFMLWYVPSDINKLAHQLEMAMEVSLSSRANVCELLELVDVIESTQVSSLPDTWRKRTYQTID